MKRLNKYINEKLHLNKDIKLSNNAFDIFKKIVKIEDDKAYDIVNEWIEKNKITTFDEIYAYEKDVDIMHFSKSQRDMLHIMSLKTYNETMNDLTDKEDSIITLYFNNIIQIDGTKNVIQFYYKKLMEQAFVFYYKR